MWMKMSGMVCESAAFQVVWSSLVLGSLSSKISRETRDWATKSCPKKVAL